MLRRQPEQRKARMEYLPGRLLVRVKEEPVRAVAPASLRWDRGTASSLPEAVAEPLGYLRRNAGLTAVAPVFSQRAGGLSRASLRAPDRQNLAVMSSVADSRSENLRGINVMRVDPKKVNARLMRSLSSSQAIEFVEPMPARWTQAARRTEADPKLNSQWGLRAIRWFNADVPSAARVEVAILDTGVDRRHPDLENARVTLKANGHSRRDILGHGTHVAGIIGAWANNGIGIAGVATCRMTMYKVFPDEPEDDGEYYVDGDAYLASLEDVLDGNARVLNLSLAGTASSRTETLVFETLQDQGVVVVAAMGNEYDLGNPTMYPAAYKGVISVGAVGQNHNRAWFSNTGRHIDLVAPGVNILSTVPRGPSEDFDDTDYDVSDGTSMAAPHVAAAAALLVAQRPAATVGQVRKRLHRTRKLPRMRNANWTRTYGHGLLDVPRALW